MVQCNIDGVRLNDRMVLNKCTSPRRNCFNRNAGGHADNGRAIGHKWCFIENTRFFRIINI